MDEVLLDVKLFDLSIPEGADRLWDKVEEDDEFSYILNFDNTDFLITPAFCEQYCLRKLNSPKVCAEYRMGRLGSEFMTIVMRDIFQIMKNKINGVD